MLLTINVILINDI